MLMYVHSFLKKRAKYLKVEEDDVVFNLAFDAACETVAAAVGKFDENSARMKLALFFDHAAIV